MRLHYIKKNYNNKTLKQRFVEEKNNHINLSILLFISSITFKSMTTSTKSSYLFISITKAQIVRFIEFSIDFSITSTNLIVSVAFKSSRHHKFTCMFYIFSSSSSQTSMLKYQESYRKSYFIMNDLFEMFAEKSSKKSMNITQKKSTFSCFFEFRQFRQIHQTRIKSLRQRDFKNTIMFARKQFKRNLNAIRKKMRFSFSSMFDQIQIINYFKFADQSNFKSIKFNTFINCFNSTSRFCFSINRTAETSQYQQIAIDAMSFRFFEQEYIVVADVYHINKNIRVETSLTNARKYNSIKSSIKLFKSHKSFKKLKFSIFSNKFNFNNKFNSTSRICFSVNQVAETSQYQHIAIDKIKLFKSLKFVVFINSFNSTFRFSLSINYDSIISQILILISSRIDFFRVSINQMIYVSINSRFRRFKQRYLVSSTFSHKHLNIRVETTLRKKKK